MCLEFQVSTTQISPRFLFQGSYIWILLKRTEEKKKKNFNMFLLIKSYGRIINPESPFRVIDVF